MAFILPTFRPLRRRCLGSPVPRHASPLRLHPVPRRAHLTASATQPAVDTAAPSPALPFNWLEQWYPVAWADDITPLKPYPFTVWQRRYVLFLDRATGTYVAMDDVCPHRVAPLSEGRLFERPTATGVSETILECGYHGWRFDCSGRCVDIPVMDLEKRIPAAADVGAVYATSVQISGLIFVYLGDRLRADETTIPHSKALEGVPSDKLLSFRNARRRLPTNFVTIVENVVDPAHVQFSHHGVQGNRYKVPRSGGVKIMESRPENGFWKAALYNKHPDNPRAFVTYMAPSAVHYDISASKMGSFHLLTWLLPVDHNTCELFSINVVNDPPWKLRLIKKLTPRWYEHTISNAVLDGDTPLLRYAEDHLQRRRRDQHGEAWKQEYFLASGAWDTLVVAFRRWLDDNAPHFPYVSAVRQDATVETLPREVINDRYEHHTKDCGCCAPALRNFKMGLVGVLVGAGVAGAVVLFSALTYLALVGGGAEFAVRPLVVAGVVGLVSCVLLLVVARKIRQFIELLTYSEVAMEKRLAA